MKGIVDNESLAIIPQKIIREFVAGPVYFVPTATSAFKTFYASDFPGIKDLKNPALLSSGIFIMQSEAPPDAWARFVISRETTVVYEPSSMGGFGKITIYQSNDTSIMLRGRYLWFKFVFLCDDVQSE